MTSKLHQTLSLLLLFSTNNNRSRVSHFSLQSTLTHNIDSISLRSRRIFSPELLAGAVAVFQYKEELETL
ncbi:unnamed protein product [Arabidopsis lyrata]|nr:unnamed protein product [Arabidopsis lyrata]